MALQCRERIFVPTYITMIEKDKKKINKGKYETL